MLETIKAIQKLVLDQEQKGIIITDIKIDVKKSTVIESVGVTIVCEDAPQPNIRNKDTSYWETHPATSHLFK